ncbi:MAG: type I DNA topoisomerase [Candidatus Eisenbacteria bacterium]|nr:type I DNA topoisomerase [Candidatus Eisenbacteria bacterium]
MAKNLVIVESPTKAKTIKKYLGTGFDVMASSGHIMDLPKNKLGVDVENDFEPAYVQIRGKAKIVKELKAEAKKASNIFLAPDPDREGEAIAAHLRDLLGGGKAHVQRLDFYEITKPAILKALEHPREIDQNKVDAQQARRVLDRLVGYQVSPFLWGTIRYGLSAGRVQTVALRLICEREAEIDAFVREEYWSVHVELSAPGSPLRFKARLMRKDGEKLALPDAATAHAAARDLGGAEAAEGPWGVAPAHPDYEIREVKRQEKRRQAPAPFTTSSLQQESFRRLHFSSQRTMVLAQQLYEGIELGGEGSVGLITYMRTDSTRISQEALGEVRGHIETSYGKEYLPAKPNAFAVKASAQDAHEAVRPTSVERTPESVRQFLTAEQFRLYQLIWRRFVACQMGPAVYDQTSADIQAGAYTLRATGTVMKFDGFTHVYADIEPAGETPKDERGVLPPLAAGMKLTPHAVLPEQHFTEPPPRYSEASLIRALEENGIGRPSTYATIVSTITTRDYVNKDKGKLTPTDLGKAVFTLLMKIMPNIFDVGFTAHMEDDLDKVEEGKLGWRQAVREFYDPFEKLLKEAESRKEALREEVSTVSQELCERCGKNLVLKYGRHGPFLACPGYPDCKFTKPLKAEEAPVPVDDVCPTCGAGMVIRTGRYGRFVACSRYPECKTTKPVSTGVKCPDCKEGDVTERRSKRGRVFYGCNRYPDCKFASWDPPVPTPCEACGNPFLVKKKTQAKGEFYRCPNPKCKAEYDPSEVESRAEAT